MVCAMLLNSSNCRSLTVRLTVSRTTCSTIHVSSFVPGSTPTLPPYHHCAAVGIEIGVESIYAARASWPGSHPTGISGDRSSPLGWKTGVPAERFWPLGWNNVGASRFRRDRLRLRRHVRVWAPVIACKTKVANDNLALAA